MNLTLKKFKSAKFIESGRELRNPERGWYQIHTFKMQEDFTMVDREYTLNNLDSLALLLIDIGAYKNSALDSKAIEKFRMIFDFFRDYRLGMIVRVVYDTEGKCMENEPSNEAQIMEHMRQIGSVLRDYAPDVFVFQGLLIGNWGEMHSSKFLSPGRIKNLTKVFREEIGDSTFMAVRRPSYIRILFPEGEDLHQNSIGLFDDGIMASPTHLGTFGNVPSSKTIREHAWHPSEELKYVSKLCDNVPYGGEALWTEEEDALTPVRKSLKLTAEYFSTLHLTYLNRIHDMRFIDNLRSLTWKEKGPYKGLNGYDYIERHLGYRFVVRSAKCEVLSDNKNILKWEIIIENVGFARSYFESAVYITGKDDCGRDMKVDVSDWIDLSKITSHEKHVFTCMTEKIYGKIYISAVKASTKETVYFANDNAEDGSRKSDILMGEYKL